MAILPVSTALDAENSAHVLLRLAEGSTGAPADDGSGQKDEVIHLKPII
jgi:hypothetical protein